MKKFSYVVLVVIMLLVTPSVNAMTKDELINKLTRSYTIAGKTVQASAAQVAELERYLNTYNVSSSDADYIAGKFDEALAIAQNSNATSYSDLTQAEKQRMVNIISDISNSTSVKMTLTEGGKLTVYESDGVTPFTIITDKDNIIQNTNSNYTIVIIASIISLLGIAVVVKKVAKANA